MIVYMIMDQKTGRWWHRGPDPGWTDKQESGSVYTQESHANLSMRQIVKRAQRSKPVKLRFGLVQADEYLSNDTYCSSGGEVWTLAGTDEWLWGTQTNGCGVSRGSLNAWNARAVVGNQVTELNGYPKRDDAMKAALKFFKEQTNATQT